jgi:hypothetical protein
VTNPTTRRFPRTTLEAWPNRHPYSVERYSRRSELALDITLAVILGVAFGLSLVVWWAGQ